MLLKTWLLCYLIQVSLGTGSVKMTNSEILVLKDESQDLREKLALLKGQVDEMFEEIKNQNHAVFKQSDHSRILSGKVSNMSKEIKLLKEENSILRDRLELHEFKTGKRFKKVKQKLDILAEGLVQCCPSFLETDPNEPNYNHGHNRSPSETHSSYEGNTKKKDKKEHKRRNKEERKERRKKKNRKEGKKSKVQVQPMPPSNFEPNLDLEPLYSPRPPSPPITSNYNEEHFDQDYGVVVHSREPMNHIQYEEQDQYSHRPYSNIDKNPNQYVKIESSQILITGGSSNSSEYFDADANGGYLRCPSPPPYPIMVEGAFGTFIEGHPLICGGRSSVENYYRSCYFYQNTNNSWVKTTPMIEPRFQASAVMIDSRRWWITSGFSGEKVYNSTEIYEAGVGFQSGPSIPMATFQHCIVKINTTHIFTVGGFPYTRNTWLMDFEEERWSRQKPINHLRDAPHCAKVERRNGKVEIIVAGGSLPGSEFSTEIFSVTDNRWRSGTNLPQAIIYGVSVSFRNAMLILGGHEMGGDLDELDLVYQYDPTKEIWTVLNQRLQSTRTSFVAISLPNYYTCSSFPLPTTPTPYGYQPGSKIFF